MAHATDGLGLDASLVAEVLVDPDGPNPRRGSGYAVRGGAVLTAAHVVDRAGDIRVRFDADRPTERTVPGTVVWHDAGIDVAVVAIEEPSGTDRALSCARVVEADAVVACSAVGFPRFKLRDDRTRRLPDGRPTQYRDMFHAVGVAAALSNRREGTLEITVPPPERDPDPRTSPWEGMSGAAVWSGGHLIGVVSAHHRSDGPGRLAASRLDRWYESLPAERLAELCRLAGLPAARDGLAAVPSRPPRDLASAAYLAQVRDLAPPALHGRQAELEELTRFCAGPEPYVWWQAGPWAGKTALAAWFTLHPPAGVSVASFFITGRLAGHADSEAFTAAMVDQLATIAGVVPPAGATPYARDAQRRLLLTEAAERLAGQGRRLLLVVDGLDEDLGATPGGLPSIASLLPRRPPPNVRVLVTGRPHPDVPLDVPDDHPLRHCRRVRLSASSTAHRVELNAKRELAERLHGDPLELDVIGLLTASGGGLRTADLAALTEQPVFAVAARLESGFGRILERRHPTGGAEPIWLFAHETLRTTAESEFAGDLTGYRARLHRWAGGYRERGWPPDTPGYLLGAYGRLLAAAGERDTLAEITSDPARQDLMFAATYSDAAGLAEVAAVQALVAGADPADLHALGLAAAAGDRLLRRGRAVPVHLPGLWERLGEPARAEACARALPDPNDRAWALADVACLRTAAAAPKAEAAAPAAAAAALAEEAAALAEEARAALRTDEDRPRDRMADAVNVMLGRTFHHSEVAGVRVAAALAGTGQADEAGAVARTTPEAHRSAAWMAIHEALRDTDPDRAAAAVASAVEAAHACSDVDERVDALIGVALALRTGYPATAADAATAAATAAAGAGPPYHGLDGLHFRPEEAAGVRAQLQRIRRCFPIVERADDPIMSAAAAAAVRVGRFDRQDLVDWSLGDPAGLDAVLRAVESALVTEVFADMSETVLWSPRRDRAEVDVCTAVARALMTRGFRGEARMLVRGVGHRSTAWLQVLAGTDPAAVEAEAGVDADPAGRATALTLAGRALADGDPQTAHRFAVRAERIARDVPPDYAVNEAAKAAARPGFGPPPPRLVTAAPPAVVAAIRLATEAQAMAHRDASEARRLLAEAIRSVEHVDIDRYDHRFVALSVVAAAGVAVDPPAAGELVDVAAGLAHSMGAYEEYAIRVLAAMLADRQPDRAAALRRDADRVAADSGRYGRSQGERIAGLAVLLADVGLGDLAETSVGMLGNDWDRAEALAAMASALGRTADPALTHRARRIAAGLLRDPKHWWQALRVLTDTDPAIARAVGARVQAGAAAVG